MVPPFSEKLISDYDNSEEANYPSRLTHSGEFFLSRIVRFYSISGYHCLFPLRSLDY